MKTSESGVLRQLQLVLCLMPVSFAVGLSLSAQVTLAGGDIAFTGYITSSVTDSFSFIVLRKEGISAATLIQFTDNGWLATGAGRSGEGILEWKADRLVGYGEQVKVWAGTLVGADKGTVRKASGNFDLANGGDQLFAFQGNWPTPTVLIAGLHYNRTTTTTESGWDVGVAASGSASIYPPGLCATCGVWVRSVTAPVADKTVSAYYKGNYDSVPAVFRERLNSNTNWESTFTSNPLWTLPPVIPVGGNIEVPVVTDTSIPRIISVFTTMPEGLYTTGEEINMTLLFDKAVVVNTTEGVPALELNVGPSSGKAVYAAGSCSSAVTYIYRVAYGDTSTALDYKSQNALQLRSGTIQAMNGRHANLLLPKPGEGASLAAQKRIQIDARPPVITPYQSFTTGRLAANGTVVGVATATDEGPAGTQLRDWTITQGNSGGAFVIHSETGAITVANQDVIAEATQGFALMLSVSDGINRSVPEEITILLRELPADTILFSPVPLYENRPSGTIAGRLALTSGNAQVVYNLVAGNGDTHNHLFTINGTELQTAQPLNYEEQAEYHVRIRASVASRFVDTTFVIHVLDVNDAPTIDEIADQVVCNDHNMQQLALTGISSGQETEQCVVVTATSNREEFFSQFIVVRETDGSTFLRYRLKEGVTGDVVVTIVVKDTGGKANGGVDSTTYSFTITVHSTEALVIQASGHTRLAAGETVTLTADAHGRTGNYQWYLNDTAINGATGTTYRVDRAHTGNYSCSLTSTAGCISLSNSILVSDAEVPITLLVYPNPARGRIYVSFSGYEDRYVYLVIYNSAGMEVKRKRIWHASSDQKDEIDTGGLPSGIYVLSIISGQNEIIGSTNFFSVF